VVLCLIFVSLLLMRHAWIWRSRPKYFLVSRKKNQV
jgi:hypothetical protein